MTTGARLTRRTALAAALSFGARTSRAADPPVRLLVGAPGGSGSDIEARTFAPFLERHLPPIEVSVVNLPGQAGLEAYRALTQAPADGLTFGWAATPNLPARMIDRSSPDLMSRLTLLGAVQREPIVLVAPAGANASVSVDLGLFQRAAATGQPFGTPPAGSPSHLAALRLQELTGTRLNLVVFPSVPAVRQAVIAGNVAVATLALSDATGPLREGRMSGLGLAAEHQAAAFPDLRPLSEAGIPLDAYILRGIAAPSALPAEQVAQLVSALRAVAADPEFQAQADATGFEVIWLDGLAWTARTDAERHDLALLWQRAPWMRGGTG